MLVRHRPTVLVTGANGFVGTALVKYLLATDQYFVRGASRVPASWPAKIDSFAVGDVSGQTNWQAALTNADMVVHLAARVHVMREASHNPLAAFRRVNVAGTLALAEQAAQRGVSRFVFLSSIKVNGEEGVFSESDAPAPTDAYGLSKLEAENGLRELAARAAMQVVVIRPPLVYGPGVKANFAGLMKLVSRGIPLPLAGVHNQRSFVSIDNLTNFIGETLTNPHAADETFFVSDGHDLSTPQLIEAMANAVRKKARLFFVPTGLIQTAASIAGKKSMAKRLLGTLQVDITKARKLLNWQPLVSVEEALRRTVAAS